MGARSVSYLGPHEMRRLDLACVPIRRAFRATPMLVGSVLTQRDYRDVDVRLILPDDHPVFGQGDLNALNYLLSESLRLTTDLPVDFQIQRHTEADTFDGARNPLGVRWMTDHRLENDLRTAQAVNARLVEESDKRGDKLRSLGIDPMML